MTISFTYKTNKQKIILQDIIRKEAENRFKFDYQFGVFTENKVYVHIKDKAYQLDLEYAKQQRQKKEFSLSNGNMITRLKHEQDDFVSSVLNQISFKTEITTSTEFKVVEFDSTDPGINTDEGFFFFNLKTKHCGEFLYRTFNKKAFVDFGNQLEKNHKGPYRIEVFKDTNYICSTPELYDPATHETQNNPNI